MHTISAQRREEKEENCFELENGTFVLCSLFSFFLTSLFMFLWVIVCFLVLSWIYFRSRECRMKEKEIDSRRKWLFFTFKFSWNKFVGVISILCHFSLYYAGAHKMKQWENCYEIKEEAKKHRCINCLVSRLLWFTKTHIYLQQNTAHGDKSSIFNPNFLIPSQEKWRRFSDRLFVPVFCLFCGVWFQFINYHFDCRLDDRRKCVNELKWHRVSI